MKRGEVHWADLDYPDRRRPVIILTRDSAIGYLSNVTVAPVTTSIRQIPSAVRLGPEDGLTEDCVANLHNLFTISKSKIGSLITVLGETKMAQVEEALLFALGMDRLLNRRAHNR